MKVRLGENVAPRMLHLAKSVSGRLRAWGVVDDDERSGTIVFGATDPFIAANRPASALVVVPLLGPRRSSPAAQALVARADAVVLVDPVELWDAEAAVLEKEVLICGIPRPEEASDGAGIDMGDAPGYVVQAWQSDEGARLSDGPGVAWVWGRGAEPLVAAVNAWASGRAVVALPGTQPHGMLHRGGVLFAGSTLEVVEATRLLRTVSPLAHALARKGAKELDRLPSLDRTAEVVAEAVVLAGGKAVA